MARGKARGRFEMMLLYPDGTRIHVKSHKDMDLPADEVLKWLKDYIERAERIMNAQQKAATNE